MLDSAVIFLDKEKSTDTASLWNYVIYSSNIKKIIQSYLESITLAIRMFQRTGTPACLKLRPSLSMWPMMGWGWPGERWGPTRGTPTSPSPTGRGDNMERARWRTSGPTNPSMTWSMILRRTTSSHRLEKSVYLSCSAV